FPDAAKQSRAILQVLEQRGYVVRAPHEDDRDGLVNDATQKALQRFDETSRELALLHYREIDRDLGPILTRFIVAETVRRFRVAGDLHWPAGFQQEKVIDELTARLSPDYGSWLSRHPTPEDVSRLNRDVAVHLHEIGAVPD